MEILLVGGFLGSGKTTLINQLLHGMVEAGHTAALIENEVCETGIDAALTEGAGLRVVPLFGGCVCCQLAGSLLETVRRLDEELHPNQVVVELTGLAMMDGLRDTFARYGGRELAGHVRAVTVVDMARWEKLAARMEPVLRRQLTGADLVAVNKVDVAPLTPEARAQIEDMAPGAGILTLCANTLSPAEAWRTVQNALREVPHV